MGVERYGAHDENASPLAPDPIPVAGDSKDRSSDDQESADEDEEIFVKERP